MPKSSIIGEMNGSKSAVSAGPAHAPPPGNCWCSSRRGRCGHRTSPPAQAIRPCAEQLLAAVSAQIGGQHADTADGRRRHRVVGVLLERRRGVQRRLGDRDRRPDPVGPGQFAPTSPSPCVVDQPGRQRDGDFRCRRVRHCRHHPTGGGGSADTGDRARGYRCALVGRTPGSVRSASGVGMASLSALTSRSRRRRLGDRLHVVGDGYALTGLAAARQASTTSVRSTARCQPACIASVLRRCRLLQSFAKARANSRSRST